MPLDPKQQPPYYTGNNGTQKIYNAIMRQTGTATPIITEIQNTLGEITWTRNGPGDYNGAIPIPDINKANLQLTISSQTSAFLAQGEVYDDGISIFTFDNTWTNIDLGSFNPAAGLYIKITLNS